MGMRPLGFTYADILNCYVTTTHLKQESRLYLLFLILFTFLIALTGFLVTPSAQCPANEERFSSSGVILSPGFPSNYPNSQTCSWLLRMIPGTVCILSVCLSMGLHMCVGIILWLKTYHLHLDATKETDLFTVRTKILNLTHSLSEMTLKLCVIYLTLTCFILEPDRPLCLHLVFQPKYAYICIRLCMCLCICYTLCVACYSTFALGSKWLLPPPSGYTINIYVEMFHSEKQFDELEIFDGKQSFPTFVTSSHTRILRSSFNLCFLVQNTNSSVNKIHNT